MNRRAQALLDGLIAFVAGVLIAYLLACIAHTQTILAGLTALGITVSPSDRLVMTLGDIVGLWRYALVIALGLAIGFSVMLSLSRWLPVPLSVRLAIGGFIALATVLASMRMAFSITPIASARGVPGFVLQCVAGAVGGMAASLSWKVLHEQRPRRAPG